MVPRPPVPGMPMEGVAVRALSWKLLLPAAIRVSGLRMDARATWPTTTCVAVGILRQDLAAVRQADMVQLRRRRAVLRTAPKRPKAGRTA